MQKVTTIHKKRHPELSVSIACIVTNLMLAVIKLSCGLLCAAPALVADAIHSAADLFSTIIVLFGLRLSAKPPDKRHPFGHERFECIASILLSGILLIAGVGIGYGGITTIITGEYLSAAAPMPAAIFIALLSVAAKLILSRYMNAVSKKIHSTALRADAFHQISDALASLGALFGIVASILGFPIFEPLASIFIAFFLFHAALCIFKEAVAGLIDRSAEDDLEGTLRLVIKSVDGVTVRALRTRRFGSKLYVETEVLLDPSRSIASCTSTSNLIRERVINSDPCIKGCTVLLIPAHSVS